jgi:four helix bundle protein
MSAAKRYEELDTWQLCVELRDRIFNWIESTPQIENWKFRDQILDSSSSPPRNVAEGFGRFKPKEFASFVRIARASLSETRNHLQDAQTKKYLTSQQAADLLHLTNRCLGAVTNLLRYLDACQGEAPTGWSFPKPKKKPPKAKRPTNRNPEP